MNNNIIKYIININLPFLLEIKKIHLIKSIYFKITNAICFYLLYAKRRYF